jgi:HK97 family phage major capsid protein
MSEELKWIEKSLEVVQIKLDQKLADHTAAIEKHGKATTELTGQIDALSEKHAEMQAKMADLIQRQADGFAPERRMQESSGALFVKSAAFEALRAGSTQNARLEVKNTILGSAGSPLDPSDVIAAPDRQPGIVPGAFRALTVLDFVSVAPTASNQVYYTQEDTFVDRAAEQIEGAVKAESDVTFKLVEEPVRTIAHWLKLSKQVLDDAPALEAYVNRRLTHGVRQRLQRQILRGTGTSPQIAGLSASGRHTAFTPVSGDIALDSINRAKYAVIGADFTPNVVFINPANWGGIERAKISGSAYALADGAAVTYVNNGLNPLVWGMSVVPSNDVESGKFYVADSNAFQLWTRQAVTVELGFVNDDFTRNLLTLRAELRAALAVYQPTAVRYGDLLA